MGAQEVYRAKQTQIRSQITVPPSSIRMCLNGQCECIVPCAPVCPCVPPDFTAACAVIVNGN